MSMGFKAIRRGRSGWARHVGDRPFPGRTFRGIRNPKGIALGCQTEPFRLEDQCWINTTRVPIAGVKTLASDWGSDSSQGWFSA